jgi:hypothetical protein
VHGGSDRLLYDLYLVATRCNAELAQLDQAWSLVERAAPLAKALDESGLPLSVLEVDTLRLRLHRMSESADSTDANSIRQSLLDRLAGLSDGTLATYPRLLRDLALEIGTIEPPLLLRLLRLLGLGYPDYQQFLSLASAFIEPADRTGNFDQFAVLEELLRLLGVSADAQQPPTAEQLAQQFVQVGPERLQKALLEIFAKYNMTHSIATALVDILQGSEVDQDYLEAA